MVTVRQLILVTLVAWTIGSAVRAVEIADDIETIAKVGPQAVGSKRARAAHDRLVQCGVEILPQLLVAMDTTNIVASNWYRSAFDQVIERAAPRSEAELPLPAIQTYVHDATRQGRARRLALDLISDYVPRYRESVMPRFLDDREFRSDAVDHVLRLGGEAELAGDREQAQQQFQLAFDHARESDQVTAAADRLKDLNVEVDIIGHLGFVTRWYVLGPFDAPGTSGFEKSFPPEDDINLNAEHVGQDGSEIRWKLIQTDDRMGQLNLIQAIAAVKEAVGYAYSEILSPRDQEVQLRCGADDNLTVWLNDKKILSREQWLNSTRLDRFTAPASLQAGINRVLVKICQGPQHVNPSVPNNWSLQLRFCDATGASAETTCRLPGPYKSEHP